MLNNKKLNDDTNHRYSQGFACMFSYIRFSVISQKYVTMIPASIISKYGSLSLRSGESGARREGLTFYRLRYLQFLANSHKGYLLLYQTSLLQLILPACWLFAYCTITTKRCHCCLYPSIFIASIIIVVQFLVNFSL